MLIPFRPLPFSLDEDREAADDEVKDEAAVEFEVEEGSEEMLTSLDEREGLIEGMTVCTEGSILGSRSYLVGPPKDLIVLIRKGV